MSDMNTLSSKEANVLRKALLAYAAELQAEIDYRRDVLDQFKLDADLDDRELRTQFIAEIEEKRHSLDEVFALRVKIFAIITATTVDHSTTGE